MTWIRFRDVLANLEMFDRLQHGLGLTSAQHVALQKAAKEDDAKQ